MRGSALPERAIGFALPTFIALGKDPSEESRLLCVEKEVPAEWRWGVWDAVGTWRVGHPEWDPIEITLRKGLRLAAHHPRMLAMPHSSPR